MATHYGTDKLLGADLDGAFTSAATQQTGVRVQANDNRTYIYVYAAAAVDGTAGDVTRSASADFVYSSAATASAKFRAHTSAAAGTYGWVYASAGAEGDVL